MDRTIHQPKYSVLKGSAGIAQSLLDIRAAEVERSTNAVERVVRLKGIDVRVVKKRSGAAGAARTVFVVDGQVIDWSKLMSAIEKARKKLGRGAATRRKSFTK